MTDNILRIGIGGPVGSGKTALVEALVPRLIAAGRSPGVITNDIYTQEDAEHVRRELAGVLDPERVVGVETGACPHTAVRDDPTMNLAAGEEMLERFPDIDTLIYESGGDNLTLTFSPALADVFVFVLDTSEGEKMPRKRGPGHHRERHPGDQQDRHRPVRAHRPRGDGARRPRGARRQAGGADQLAARRRPAGAARADHGRVVGVDVGPHRLSAAPAVHHGGPRLQPAHFEPDRVPPEVARYGTDAGTSAAGTLAVGSPGKVGVLELDFELRGPSGRRRTELVHHYQKTPLQIMRPLYFDEARPDMPYTYVMTTGGGVLHGDRQRSDLRFGPGTSAHVTTQAHTKVHRMEHGYATRDRQPRHRRRRLRRAPARPADPVRRRPLLPAHPRDVLAESATVRARRDAVRRTAVARRAQRLRRVRQRPRGGPARRTAAWWSTASGSSRAPVASAVSPCSTTATSSPRCTSSRRSSRRGPSPTACTRRLGATIVDDTRFGVSVLPGDSGAWLRMVGDDTVTMARAWTAAWGAAHELLTGTPAPHIRK